ncbi:MAG: DUF4238 domain-containing protein [Thermodesulfobacteriota bacterium]
MTQYRRNHYVPVWYQERFFPPGVGERKFFYLDLRPETIVSNGQRFKRNSLLRWCPKNCFCQDDLYTTKYGPWFSTEIEEKFFGPIDASARPALDYFTNFTHPSADGEHFQRLVRYMSVQKLRTPKGLAYLSVFTRQVDRNRVLIELQQLQQLFCAIWTECVWSIADALQAETKFLLSDHPVTVYNRGCFPASEWCRDYREPDIWLTGTHTLFPLTLEKILILTNLSWVRYPYGNPVRPRPNPNPFRPAMINFMQIQIGRKLSDQEVVEINYIIKVRAYRYVVAANRSWLYPEERIGLRRWDTFGENYLLMPVPRSVAFSGEIIIGYKNNKADFFDAYGRKPWQSDYDNKAQHDREWETFHAFQGEFARRFGPKRRGLSFEFGKLSNEQDTDDFHKYHLSLEQKHKKHRYKPRRSKS